MGMKTSHLRRMWRSEEFDELKPTVYDWCRLAAFIDGEGHLNINPYGWTSQKTRKVQVRVLVGNTNPNLPVWIQETFGGNVVLRRNKNPRCKDAYIWSCTAARAAWILHNCLPWFLLKRAQAVILLQLQEDIDKTHQARSFQLSEECVAYRTGLKDQLHKLNAKGPAVKITAGSEE